uniref:Uncharacterized protein n=1 Tax=Schizaphis graminum TaxID=13262 RepID=A0A2S2NX81_SCHGA
MNSPQMSGGSCRRAWRVTRCPLSSVTRDIVPRPLDSCAYLKCPPPLRRTACAAPVRSPPSAWQLDDCHRPCHHRRRLLLSYSCRWLVLMPHPPSSEPCWKALSERWLRQRPSCPPPSTIRDSLSFFYLLFFKKKKKKKKKTQIIVKSIHSSLHSKSKIKNINNYEFYFQNSS